MLLMLILPLSAVGLDISVHKCKQKGTLHFSLFNFSANKHNKSCCCAGCDIARSAESAQSSCCGKDISANDKTDGIEESVEAPSCCSKTAKTPIPQKETIAKNESKSNSAKGSGIINYENPCCTDANYNYVVSVASESPESNKLVLNIQPNAVDLFRKFNLNPNSSDIVSSKEIRHPLKEPICCIISFIHFTYSNADGDDAYQSHPLVLS